MIYRQNIKSPLPIIFICGIIIVAVLNISTFNTIYKTNIIEAEVTNKQTALSSLETKYQNQVVGKANYLDLNGLFSRIIDKKELNERYKLNNGYLTTFQNYSDMNSQINNITNIKKYLDLYDIPFAFVQTPFLIPTDNDSMIPAGYETHTNGNSDRLLEGLKNNGVNYLDLRENFKEDGLNNYELFQITDHHWTNEAGFISTKYVAEFIDIYLGESLILEEYFVTSRFNFELFENKFLGSYGDRTGVYYTGTDDIVLITPNFQTNFNVEFGSNTKIGDFKETIINYDILDNNLSNELTKNAYMVYNLHENYVKITNNNATNDKVILLLRDSYTASIAPFLALHYKEIHLYDVRSYLGGSSEGFIEKIHEINPDIVLQIRHTRDHLTDEAKAQL